jgi:hypothetical protein
MRIGIISANIITPRMIEHEDFLEFSRTIPNPDLAWPRFPLTIHSCKYNYVIEFYHSQNQGEFTYKVPLKGVLYK